MDSRSKLVFTNLSKDETFDNLVKKVTIGQELNYYEWSYVLACSLTLLEQYNKTKEESYFQFAYYLILKYSFSTGNYKPLYDFSIDAGFFPISSHLSRNMNNSLNVDDWIIDSSVKTNFVADDIIYLEQQKKILDSFIKDSNRYKSLIAPTSYGKSSFIEKDIEKHSSENKIAVIVPTKALIWQTFGNLRDIGRLLKRKILVHDTEYGGEKSFIGIFTQERALRLLEDNNLSFDTIYVDEAHNIFEKDDRSILLARLLKINEKNNPNQRVVFLSPLVEQSTNFEFRLDSLISENKIVNNIKEYDIKYYDEKTKITEFYNRFTNDYVPINENSNDIFYYIFNNSTEKNLVYFYSPKKIELFAKEFCEKVSCKSDPQLLNLASLVESYSSEDYLLVETIKRGAIYIHSKIPDFLKNYLYDCFNKIPSIKYLISNGCVLEGVDFPISSLFILDTYSLTINRTTNLIGRVNRLKNIFNEKESNLKKLLCPIHYLDSKKYCSGKVKNKIELLRSNIKDVVKNPTLIKAKTPTSDDELKDFNLIKSRENLYVDKKIESKIALSLIKNGVDKRYADFDDSCRLIEEKIKNYSCVCDLERLMNSISEIFVRDHTFKGDHISLGRFKLAETVNYYYNYLCFAYHGTLKSKISYITNSIDYIKTNNSSNGKIFVDTAFGTTTLTNKPQDYYKAYVDVLHLDKKAITNISIIKSKVEDEFLDFVIAPYVKILFETEIINEDLYNKFLYGTVNTNLIMLYKLGLSAQFIKFVVDNDLLQEMKNLGYGIKVTDRFKEELKKQDDIVQFEISYYLVD